MNDDIEQPSTGDAYYLKTPIQPSSEIISGNTQTFHKISEELIDGQNGENVVREIKR